jgi:excisionase family DNA binding protein
MAQVPERLRRYDDMALLHRPEEVAKELGVSRAKVWQWIKSGRIGSVKIDGMRRVRQQDIDAFMASLEADRSAAS